MKRTGMDTLGSDSRQGNRWISTSLLHVAKHLLHSEILEYLTLMSFDFIFRNAILTSPHFLTENPPHQSEGNISTASPSTPKKRIEASNAIHSTSSHLGEQTIDTRSVRGSSAHPVRTNWIHHIHYHNKLGKSTEECHEYILAILESGKFSMGGFP